MFSSPSGTKTSAPPTACPTCRSWPSVSLSQGSMVKSVTGSKANMNIVETEQQDELAMDVR